MKDSRQFNRNLSLSPRILALVRKTMDVKKKKKKKKKRRRKKEKKREKKKRAVRSEVTGESNSNMT